MVERVDVAVHGAQVAAGIAGHTALQRLDRSPHRGERGAQVVADRGQQDLPLALVPDPVGLERSESGDQRVERVGDGADLVVALESRPGVQVAVRDGRRRLADPPEVGDEGSARPNESARPRPSASTRIAGRKPRSWDDRNICLVATTTAASALATDATTAASAARSERPRTTHRRRATNSAMPPMAIPPIGTRRSRRVAASGLSVSSHATRASRHCRRSRPAATSAVRSTTAGSRGLLHQIRLRSPTRTSGACRIHRCAKSPSGRPGGSAAANHAVTAEANAAWKRA